MLSLTPFSPLTVFASLWSRDLDRDLICPCDYAPPDIKEYGACYCNLYLSSDFYEKNVDFIVVPERRPVDKENAMLEYINNNK